MIKFLSCTILVLGLWYTTDLSGLRDLNSEVMNLLA